MVRALPQSGHSVLSLLWTCLMCRERFDMANSFSQCGHGFLICIKRSDHYQSFLAIPTYPLVSLPHVPGEVVHGDVLLAVRTVGLLAQVNALHVVVQQLLRLELFLTVRTLIVAYFFMEVLKAKYKIKKKIK